MRSLNKLRGIESGRPSLAWQMGIVAAVLVLCLVGIVVGSLRSVSESAKVTACINNLRMIYMASRAYDAQYRASPFTAVKNYHQLMDLLVRTGYIPKENLPFLKCGGKDGYEYQFLFDPKHEDRLPSHHALIGDGKVNSHSSRGRCILYNDGSVSCQKDSSQ